MQNGGLHWLLDFLIAIYNFLNLHLILIIFELWHEISNNVVYGTSKASDQPAHTHSLIGAFASRWSIL